jgi:hypothetical protein
MRLTRPYDRADWCVTVLALYEVAGIAFGVEERTARTWWLRRSGKTWLRWSGNVGFLVCLCMFFQLRLGFRPLHFQLLRFQCLHFRLLRFRLLRSRLLRHSVLPLKSAI